MHADKGMGVAVTETARQRLLELEEEPENKLPSVEDAVAGLEVARVQKEETGARPVCVLGAYGQVSPLVRRLLPSLAVLKLCGDINAVAFFSSPFSCLHASSPARLAAVFTCCF